MTINNDILAADFPQGPLLDLPRDMNITASLARSTSEGEHNSLLHVTSMGNAARKLSALDGRLGKTEACLIGTWVANINTEVT